MTEHVLKDPDLRLVIMAGLESMGRLPRGQYRCSLTLQCPPLGKLIARAPEKAGHEFLASMANDDGMLGVTLTTEWLGPAIPGRGSCLIPPAAPQWIRQL